MHAYSKRADCSFSAQELVNWSLPQTQSQELAQVLARAHSMHLELWLHPTAG